LVKHQSLNNGFTTSITDMRTTSPSLPSSLLQQVTYSFIFMWSFRSFLLTLLLRIFVSVQKWCLIQLRVI